MTDQRYSRGLVLGALLIGVVTLGAKPSSAQECASLPSHADLTTALKQSVAASGGPTNGGFDLHMWATIVSRDAIVCAVTHSGDDRGDQFPGSRVISVQKANTANAFSLPGLALSTANLFSAVQPGGSLFGLQFSNPVDPAVAYAGAAGNFGKKNDPMVNKRVGGVNVFGGGLALYDASSLVGAIGVSGDSSCADHNIAWRVRDALGLDNVPGGLQPDNGDDGIIYDIDVDGMSAGGFGHPTCGGSEDTVAAQIGAGTTPLIATAHPALSDDEENAERREQMRELVVAIAEEARSVRPDFVVVTQNGLDLMVRDGDPEGPLWSDYTSVLNGVSQEGVSFGFDDYCDQTPGRFHREVLEYLDRARDSGLAALLTDYCDSEPAVGRATELAQEHGFISYVSRDEDFSLSSVPKTPAMRSKRGDVTELTEARNYLYLLDPSNFEDPEGLLGAIQETDFDVIVMDAFFQDQPLTAEEVGSVRAKSDGGQRIVLAYLNVGSVENWRYYWQDGWETGDPDWIGETYSEQFSDEFWARYWRPEWHEILYDSESSYLSTILDQGFDGVFLDNIDAYEVFEE